MGCGQSKIHLYPRKSKSKANGKKGGHADSDAETDEDEGHIEDTGKYQSREREKNDETEELGNKDAQETDEEVSVSLLRAKNLSLLQSQEISSSQQNFFRMLDKKIEEGPDYDSASETEIALEEARLNALVQHWESASLTASICSSASRSLQTTPVRQAPPATAIKPLGTARTVLQPTVPQVSDFLPHGASQPTQLPPMGSMKHPQNQQPQQQQQIVISHLNSKMLHQMAAVPQIPMNMPPEISATTANTSNALAMLQASNQPQQFAHLLPLSTGSPQLLGKQTTVSPKRIIDTRLMMSPSPLTKQTQPQIQNQFIPPAVMAPTPTTGFVNGSSGGRSPQPPMQMAYFGQPSTAQQCMQVTAAQQEPQQQLPQNQNQQPYYGEVIHSGQAPMEYRFPPAISVQRLAPQVQRQLRETQELIKDTCPQLFAGGYGSPGPPIRSQTRNNPNRRPTLETQFSQELS